MSSHNSIIFERSYGTRHISLGGDQLITSVSQPEWPSFIEAIDDVSRQKIPSLVTTPELMTSAGIDLGSISEQRPLIEHRIAEAKILSRQMPSVILLLGSIAFDKTVEKPRNAVLFLQDGAEIGRTYKKNPIGKYERQFLHNTALPHEIIKPVPNILNIICSDLVSPPPLDSQVNTLLVSACWGTPAGYPGIPASPDHRHIEFIQYLTDDLFETNPSLDTIVMTDRAPDANSVAGPFNFIAQR